MSIKYFLSLALLFVFAKAEAQVHRKGVAPIDKSKHTENTKKPDYTLAQLKGKWQEFKRTDYNGVKVDFADSLLINLVDSDKVETRTNISNSMTMTGAADIEDDNQLTVAADVYTVKKCYGGEMILDDNSQYLHYFKTVANFSYETYGKSKPLTQQKVNAVAVRIADIIGNWEVYKRDAKPGVINNNMELIKYLNIITKTGDSTASGNVTFFKGELSQQKHCTVTISNNTITVSTDLQKWQLPIVQADADNFVFGNQALLYSCKKLN